MGVFSVGGFPLIFIFLTATEGVVLAPGCLFRGCLGSCLVGSEERGFQSLPGVQLTGAPHPVLSTGAHIHRERGRGTFPHHELPTPHPPPLIFLT